MKILLISGHGAGDPGACATIGGVQYKEAEETRRVVNLLRPILSEYAEVGIYDQRRDAFGDAKTGTLKLKGWDYVLEIHFNAGAGDKGGDGRTTGTEILSPTGCGWSGTEGSIMRELAALGFTNRGRKEQALAVTGTAYRQGCKANLIEVCFIDDADDMRLYTVNSKAVAEAICRGVVSAFGLEDDNMSYEQWIKYYDQHEAELRKKPTSDYAIESSKKAVACGAFSDGDKDGLVDDPQAYVRRQELATVLNRRKLLEK